MNLQTIKEHITICDAIATRGLSEFLPSRCTVEALLSGIDKLQEDVLPTFKLLKSNTQALLIGNAQLLQYAIEFIRNDVNGKALQQLLDDVPAEEILSYPVDKIITVLNDEFSPFSCLRVYLKFYDSKQLTNDEKAALADGLQNYKSLSKNKSDTLLSEKPELFYQPCVCTQLLKNITDYDGVLSQIRQDKALLEALNLIAETVSSNIALSDSHIEQLVAQPKQVLELLQWAYDFYTEEEASKFYCLLIQNQELLHDLKLLKEKVGNGKEREAHDMLVNRASYVAFFYGEYLSAKWNSVEKENLIIYAVTHKKKAFLSLVRQNQELVQSMPRWSILFQPFFYRNLININTLNATNLKQCVYTREQKESKLQILANQSRTFNEVLALCDYPECYFKLYASLNISKVDDRLKVIRELTKSSCLNDSADIQTLATALSEKPLSEWAHNDFAYIDGIDMELAVLLLQKKEQLKHLLPDVHSAVEARYICENADMLQSSPDMHTVSQNILEQCKEWLQIREEFQFDKEFVEKNEERIRDFIYKGGANIVNKYLESVPSKKEELRRLVSAELLGRYNDVKYHGDDLEQEISFDITSQTKELWKENLSEEKQQLIAYEEDRFLPVMQIGVIPTRTCLSYEDGQYNECLLACHDSNKKVIYLTYNGKIVLRAALRLTKGVPKLPKGYASKAKLEFADITSTKTKSAKVSPEKEQLVLFLEKPYIAGLPESETEDAINLLFSLVERKARSLRACLVASTHYSQYEIEGMIVTSFALYISRSKAGKQYLDSLGGDTDINSEDRYYKGRYLVHARMQEEYFNM